MRESLKLELLSEKTLPHTANAQLIKYCPTMDLVALGSTDQQVLIYRLNGQRVYGTTQKSSTVRVESICWKPNGQLLAIAWSDGSVRLVGADSSKVVHQFSVGDDISGITCIGWASNLTSRNPISRRGKQYPQTWEDIFIQYDDFSESDTALDLPRDLSLIDIEISMPKLSVLTSGGSSEEVFSSRTSLDPLFRPFDPKDNEAVDVMVIGTREGNVHLSIYDSFVIGVFKSPVVIGGQPSHLILHASHQHYSTHALLMKTTGPAAALYFVPMDLRFVSASSGYLSLLASRSTALQNLLRYIRQVQGLMVAEWKSTQELPARFLRNINEQLEEDGNRNIVQALYHSVATGHTFPAVKEWLVDELAERGHKRWDKAVITGLENLRRLVHENILPALDRCTVILSRFWGIAKFQSSNDDVGFTSHQVSLIMDTVACLHLVASKILGQVVEELDLFTAFSAWLRYEIDRLASDSSTSSAEESNDKEASIDHNKVLRYLQTAIITSPLAAFFTDTPATRIDDLVNPIKRDGTLFALLDEQLQKHEQGLPYMESLPRVDLLCDHLAEQAQTVFKQIAESEKRNVLFGKPCELGSSPDGSPSDMKINQIDDSLCQTSIALIVEKSNSTVQIFQISSSIINGISETLQITSTAFKLGGGKIKDIKFADGRVMLVLWEMAGDTNLLTIPYQASVDDNSSFRYSPYNPKSKAHRPVEISNEEVLRKFSKHTIPSEKSFAPAKLEIREQTSGLKEDMRRVVVLGEDKLHYQVYRLPSSGPKGEADGDVPMS